MATGWTGHSNGVPTAARTNLPISTVAGDRKSRLWGFLPKISPFSSAPASLALRYPALTSDLPFGVQAGLPSGD